MSKNSIRTGKNIAQIASKTMRSSKNKTLRRLASSTLVNRKVNSK